MASAIARGDWRDERAYARLLPGDRHCFAWEWLRRAPAYAHAWANRDPPSTSGLVQLEDPACDALVIRPFWRRDVDRSVLQAETYSPGSSDRFDLGRLSFLATVISGNIVDDAAEHILLSDGLRSIRIDLLSGSLAAQPASLRWHIDGVIGIQPQLLALRQIVALARHGRFTHSLHRPERRARRWIEMLRVHDAIAAGVSHREIVAGLFGIDVTAPRWRAAAAPWQLRVQRLAAGARACLAAGPAGWLG